jgi:hypothetical protein
VFLANQPLYPRGDALIGHAVILRRAPFSRHLQFLRMTYTAVGPWFCVRKVHQSTAHPHASQAEARRRGRLARLRPELNRELQLQQRDFPK